MRDSAVSAELDVDGGFLGGRRRTTPAEVVQQGRFERESPAASTEFSEKIFFDRILQTIRQRSSRFAAAAIASSTTATISSGAAAES